MNYMKLNTGKWHLLISGTKTEYMWAKLVQDIVWESNDVELHGVTIDKNLRFGKYVSNICLKSNRKLSALTRLVKYVPFKKDVFFSIHNFPGGNLSELFLRNNHNYNLRSKSELFLPNVNTVLKGQTFFSYFGSVIWNTILLN